LYILHERNEAHGPIGDVELTSLKTLKEEIREGMPSLGEGGDFHTAVVLACIALVVGPFVNKLVMLTGYPEEFVGPICARLEKCGLWAEDGVFSAPWFDDEGRWNFTNLRAFTLVAQGLAHASLDEKRGWVFTGLPSKTERAVGTSNFQNLEPTVLRGYAVQHSAR